jgi:hypothetical protein
MPRRAICRPRSSFDEAGASTDKLCTKTAPRDGSTFASVTMGCKTFRYRKSKPFALAIVEVAATQLTDGSTFMSASLLKAQGESRR